TGSIRIRSGKFLGVERIGLWVRKSAGFQASATHAPQRQLCSADRIQRTPSKPGDEAKALHPPLLYQASGDRIRQGDYRVLYQIHDDVITVVVVRVAHRRELYKR